MKQDTLEMAATHRDRIMQGIYAKHGLAQQIADELGVTYQAIQQWKKVPPIHVLTLAEMLKMKPEDIRPDVFRPRKKAGRT